MPDLDKLYRIALENATFVREYKKRFAYEKLKGMLDKRKQGKKPAILMSGIRGVGKTTLMLQLFNEMKDAFYFSADSVLIRTSTVYSVVEQAYREGYSTIFIDEVHKHPGWVEELKSIYDDFNVQIISSGSSTAAIKKGSILLGRRAVDIQLPPLTFAEFMYLKEGKVYTSTMDEALNKRSTVKWLATHPTVERQYREYLSTGGFPMGATEKETVFRLIRRMIYEDTIAEFNLTEKKVDVAERLLSFLSLSKSGEFSYTSFSSTTGYPKSTVYETANMLIELGLLRSVKEKTPKSEAKGTMKLLFYHPNLRVAFAEQLMKEAEIGALREEYFLFHVCELGFPVFIPKGMRKRPDYEVRVGSKTLLLEIGGQSKTEGQLEGREGFVLSDENLVVLGFVQKIEQK